MTERLGPHGEYASYTDGKPLYSELRGLLDAAGCFQSEATPYVLHMLAVVLLYFGGFTVLLLSPEWPLRILAIAVVSFANIQAGVLAHEAGHGAITRRLADRPDLRDFQYLSYRAVLRALPAHP